jgi:hypothetical protein
MSREPLGVTLQELSYGGTFRCSYDRCIRNLSSEERTIKVFARTHEHVTESSQHFVVRRLTRRVVDASLQQRRMT